MVGVMLSFEHLRSGKRGKRGNVMTKIDKCGTEAPWIHVEGSPLIELSETETDVVRRFAIASRMDLQIQMARAIEDKSLKPYEINDLKNTAAVIQSWLSNVIEKCTDDLRQADQETGRQGS